MTHILQLYIHFEYRYENGDGGGFDMCVVRDQDLIKSVIGNNKNVINEYGNFESWDDLEIKIIINSNCHLNVICVERRMIPNIKKIIDEIKEQQDNEYLKIIDEIKKTKI